MFKNEEDFNYFIVKAKKDGATNDRIYAVLNEYYNKVSNEKMPEYIEKFIDNVKLNDEYLANEQFTMGIKSLRSFYLGEQLSKQELCKLFDYLKRALWQVDKQITELIQLEE